MNSNSTRTKFMDIQNTFGLKEALARLGVKAENHGTSTGAQSHGNGGLISSYSPVDGQLIGAVTSTTSEEYEEVIQQATKAFKEFREWPAPKRGEVVRQFGQKLRDYKEDLGKLVSYEMGKSYQEGLG